MPIVGTVNVKMSNFLVVNLLTTRAGSVLCAMQSILVDRKDPDSRRRAVEAIEEHANKSESKRIHPLGATGSVRPVQTSTRI